MMTLVKRSGALILALIMTLVLLVGCSSAPVDVKQNPDGSYGENRTESQAEDVQ